MKTNRYVAMNLEGFPYKNPPYTSIMLSPDGKVWLLSNVPAGMSVIAMEDITDKVKIIFYDLPEEEESLMSNVKGLLEKFGIDRCINKPEYIDEQMVCTMPMDDYAWLQAQIFAIANLSMDIEKTMKESGLFAAPLNNGDWMVGKANCIYHMNVGSDQYKDERLAIAPTLEEAIQKWKLSP
jgi:hypothetical protein